MISSVLRRFIPLLILVTALSPLYVAVFMMSVYQQHHMPVLSVWRVGAPGVFWTFVYATAAYLYWRWLETRTFVQVIAVLVGVIAFFRWFHLHTFLYSWRNIFHGDLISIGTWEIVLLMVIAVLAIVHFAAERRKN